MAKVHQTKEREEQARRDNAALAAKNEKILRDAEEQSSKIRADGRREVTSNLGSVWDKVKTIVPVVIASLSAQIAPVNRVLKELYPIDWNNEQLCQERHWSKWSNGLRSFPRDEKKILMNEFEWKLM